MPPHFKTTDRLNMADRKLIGTLYEDFNVTRYCFTDCINYLYQGIKEVE